MGKLEIKNISKKYVKYRKEITIIDNVSAKFYSGKLYAIIGKSGVGKSTLLKCMSSLLKVDEGSILIDGKDISKMNDKELSGLKNQHIGFIFQEYNLLEFLNTYENVGLPMIINGNNTFDDIEVKNKIDELLDFVELTDRKKHYPNELSGGEQQRVAIARALINNPSIILADEPTGSIDQENSENILKLLKKISKERCVIVVTHDDKVLNYADVIYKLENGKLNVK